MLCLTRKTTQSLRIGDDIIVTVLEIRGDKVRLGVEADKSIPVHRGEIYDKIHEPDPRPTGDAERFR